jgi:hypothetical protein
LAFFHFLPRDPAQTPDLSFTKAFEGCAVGHWKRLGELVAELSELPNIAGYSPVAWWTRVSSAIKMFVISLEFNPIVLNQILKIHQK